MEVLKTEVIDIRTSDGIVQIRQAVRGASHELGFSLVDQTKMVTAASEIARNTVDYGGGGIMRLEHVSNNMRRGLRLVFEDQGPGIPDIELALKDGYTSGAGLGLGLGGSRRLVNEFDVQSSMDEGTRVTLIRWK